MAITLLPTPPSRQDPANFNVRADEFLGALPTFGTEANSLATDVNNKQVTASNAATTATNAASTATNKAGEALASANAAASSASSVNTARLAAEAAYDSFDDRYLGDKSADPTTDNDGGALLVGALYFRTTAPIGMKVWTGAAWDDAYANLSSKFDKTGGNVDGNINITGAVGVGTSNPVAKLAVQGGVRIGSAVSTSYLRFTHDTANGFLDTNVGALVLQTQQTNRLVIDTTGNVLATSGLLGYGVGAGGTVVQATSKSTAVTLNKPGGQITMHDALLLVGESVVFQVTNALVAASDCVSVTASATLNYRIEAVVGAGGGYFLVRVTNVGTTEGVPLKINFAIEKVALS